LEPIVQAVGPWNCSEVSPEDLFGSFNGYLKAVLLRVSEARDMGEVSKFQLFERMNRPRCCGSTRSTSKSITSSTWSAPSLHRIIGPRVSTCLRMIVGTMSPGQI
jgi:hypothetical protein